jgi:hypothetical protein
LWRINSCVIFTIFIINKKYFNNNPFLKNQLQVVYFFSFSNFLKKTSLKCSDGNFFILLFQIKFYFSNGKLLGIVYAISGKIDDDCSITVPFSILNSDIQLDYYFNFCRINSCLISSCLSIILLTKNCSLLFHSLENR